MVPRPEEALSAGPRSDNRIDHGTLWLLELQCKKSLNLFYNDAFHCQLYWA